MSSKPTDLNELNIEIAEDGTATLIGINYQDLRSVLTAASLHRYTDEFKPKPAVGDLADVIHANNMDNARWHLDQRLLLDVLDARMTEAIRPGYSDGIPAVRRAIDRHRSEIKDLEVYVREAEAEAANAAVEEEKPDPLKEIASMLRTVVRQADGALAQVERLRSA